MTAHLIQTNHSQVNKKPDGRLYAPVRLTGLTERSAVALVFRDTSPHNSDTLLIINSKESPLDTIEFQILPGLEKFARQELERTLSKRKTEYLSSASGSILVRTTEPLEKLLALRTVVAPFLVLRFPMPRPQTILSEPHWDRLIRSVKRVQKISRFRSFRFEAAGKDSDAFQRISAQFSQKVSLPFESEKGEMVFRFRTPEKGVWEVLIRLCPYPLSKRQWRVSDMPGALNATVAACAVALSSPRKDEAVVNLMCGSGTMTIERLLHSQTGSCLGVDSSSEAIEAAQKNLRAAGVSDRAELLNCSIEDLPGRDGTADVVFADLPWNERIKTESSVANARNFIDCCERILAPSGRVICITQRKDEFLEGVTDSNSALQVVSEYSYFQKGFYPSLYLLVRR